MSTIDDSIRKGLYVAQLCDGISRRLGWYKNYVNLLGRVSEMDLESRRIWRKEIIHLVECGRHYFDSTCAPTGPLGEKIRSCLQDVARYLGNFSNSGVGLIEK